MVEFGFEETPFNIFLSGSQMMAIYMLGQLTTHYAIFANLSKEYKGDPSSIFASVAICMFTLAVAICVIPVIRKVQDTMTFGLTENLYVVLIVIAIFANYLIFMPRMKNRITLTLLDLANTKN